MLHQQNLAVCYGEVLWDILPDGPQAGGAPLNVCYHLNKLGLPAGMISRIGDDENGRELMALIKSAGIAAGLIQTDNVYKTGVVIADVNGSEEVKYTIVSPVAWDHIVYNDEQTEVLSAARYLVYGTLASREATSRDTLFKLLETDAIKVFDVNLRPPHFTPTLLHDLLLKTDILKCNQEEINIICELFGAPDDNHSQILFLQEKFGLSEIILTRGRNGALYFNGSDVFQAHPPIIKMADTIGSGDAFLAAFIYNHNQSKPAQTIIDNAVAMGAFVASKKGGCPAYQPTELHEFLNLHLQL
ncbi:carbohydrate kinase [Mucilaginibacter sp. JRF]|uniref:carbohydrate kinase family protein n=1 Tax=Mucilaginibacter sp. JRF TaxID=2780088 RepID=UPI00187DE4B8|nr:carbohydrate kinase [Mucilaginibacter sp. JRF]MBE9584462.1 carbohydrate kinase [Mucilaginibacter sp. JRF]